MAWRLAGRPSGHADHPWTDGGPTIDSALDWIAAEQLLAGLADGTWRTRRTITRAQALNLLWRQAGRPDDPTDDPWSDVTGPAYRWAAAHGLLTGYSDLTFRPVAALTRAQMANLLFAFSALPAAPASPPPTTSPPSTTNPPTTSTPTTTTLPTTLPPTTAPTTTEVP